MKDTEILLNPECHGKYFLNVFFVVFLRTSHICEIGGQRNPSEGKRGEEKGNCRIHLHGSIL